MNWMNTAHRQKESKGIERYRKTFKTVSFVEITHETSVNRDASSAENSKQLADTTSTELQLVYSLAGLMVLCTLLAPVWFMAENFPGVKLPQGRLILLGEDGVCVGSTCKINLSLMSSEFKSILKGGSNMTLHPFLVLTKASGASKILARPGRGGVYTHTKIFWWIR